MAVTSAGDWSGQLEWPPPMWSYRAFPMDKMQNGLGAAKNWVTWGWGNVVSSAKKIGDDIAKSEFVKETERLAQKAEENLQTGATEVGFADP
ncbi:hypothetical protein AK812_SmicGene6503 [Symbiodinium microadriaticum]|uniref:Uncharacterized protein n=1 Tax=Symbiodinium microadriaticum TaxID=2951 RepID=A0A1Q9EQY9_SYMMI|nr:hypothetical protein AK812_SmicGene6503 [Symbiodinium microadriaticum]